METNTQETKQKTSIICTIYGVVCDEPYNYDFD